MSGDIAACSVRVISPEGDPGLSRCLDDADSGEWDVVVAKGGFDSGELVRRNRREEAAARLGVVGERQELAGNIGRDGQRVGDEAAVVGRAAGFDA